jgi:hypothetical protein
LNAQLTAPTETSALRFAQVSTQRATAFPRLAGLQPARQRGFQRGAAHPSVLRAAYVSGKTARRTKAARRRAAAARAHFNPGSVQLTEAGIRGPMSTREKALVLDVVSVRGTTQLQAAAAAGVSQQSVSRLLQRVSAAESAAAGAAAAGAALPVTPLRNVKRRSSGRPSLLTTPVGVRVRQAFRSDPFGGVAPVHKAPLEEGIEVAPRTLHTWMKLLNVHTRATNNYADLDERLMHGLLNHVESMTVALARGEFGHEHLAYADQTPIWLHAGHNTAYSDTVVFGNAGDAKGGMKIGTVWAVVTSQGCIRAWFTVENGDELTTKDFFLSDTPPPGWINLHGRDGNIFDVLAAHGRQLRGRRKKMLLLIDRLGKSGASVYPVAGHHTPVLRVRARCAGVGLLMLPPKGALVNPIELWNMHVKTVMNAMQPAGAPKDGWQQLIRGPRDKAEALQMLKQAIIDIDAKPALMRWCYHMRATGADALRRLEGNTEFQAVRAARAAQPVAPFDVDVAADAPRARMATDHAYPRSAVTAETYNVYFWLHHHFELHEGLPPPFVRPVDAADSSERWCRLCKRTTKAGRSRSQQAVCCDNCPGLYHHECLGLEGAPAGAWSCDACVRGDVGPLRTWKAPPGGPAAHKATRKRRRDAAASDGDGE